MKLVSITRSDREGKKWKALFEDPKRTTHFGASKMQDYTQHHDKERRRLYRLRHEKDLDTNDPSRAGYLSYHVLWGDSTDMNKNIQAYKRKFNM